MAGEEVKSSTNESTQHDQEANQAVQEPNDFDLVGADTSEEVDEDEQDAEEQEPSTKAMDDFVDLCLRVSNRGQWHKDFQAWVRSPHDMDDMNEEKAEEIE